MELLRELGGMGLYFSGALIIIAPGIAYFEKYHKPGKLLRALEELETGSINEDNVGFELLKSVIVELTHSEEIKNSSEVKIYTGTFNIGDYGKGKDTIVRGFDENGEEIANIEEPTFDILRYQIDRSIRRKKTKIRTFGIVFMLVGFTMQMWPELIRVFLLLYELSL